MSYKEYSHLQLWVVIKSCGLDVTSSPKLLTVVKDLNISRVKSKQIPVFLNTGKWCTKISASRKYLTKTLISTN